MLYDKSLVGATIALALFSTINATGQAASDPSRLAAWSLWNTPVAAAAEVARYPKNPSLGAAASGLSTGGSATAAAPLMTASPSSFALGGVWSDDGGGVWTVDSTGAGTVIPPAECGTIGPWPVVYSTRSGASFTLTAENPGWSSCVTYVILIMTFTSHNSASGTFNNVGPTPFTRTGSAIILEGSDAVTQGNWPGSYGSGGYVIPNDAQTNLDHSNFSISQYFPYEWISLTTDPRALKTSPTSSAGIASAFTNYYGKSIFINLNIYDTAPHTVSFYLLDWDTSSREETFTITDASTGKLLNQSTFSNFHNGLHVSFQMKGNLLIQVSPKTGPGVTISGIFID